MIEAADLDRYEKTFRERLLVVDRCLTAHDADVHQLARVLQPGQPVDFMLTLDAERLLLWLCVEQTVLVQSLNRLEEIRELIEVPHGE